MADLKAQITSGFTVNVLVSKTTQELIKLDLSNTVNVTAKPRAIRDLGGSENTLKLIDLYIFQEHVGTIYNVISPLIYEQINDRYEFTFRTTIKENLNKLLNTSNAIEVDGNYFRVARTRRNRSLSGTIVDVTAEHVSYMLNIDDSTDEYEDIPEVIIGLLLNGTDFTVGTIEFYQELYFKPNTNTKRGRIIELAKYLGGEIIWDKFTIHIVRERGDDNGLEFEVGENVIGVTAETDASNGYQTSYEIDILDMAHLPGYSDLSEANLGDTIRILDDELVIDEKLRIISREYNPFQKVNPRVQIGNVIRDYADYTKEREEVGEEGKIIETDDGKILLQHDSGSYIEIGHDIKIFAKGKVYIDNEGSELNIPINVPLYTEGDEEVENSGGWVSSVVNFGNMQGKNNYGKTIKNADHLYMLSDKNGDTFTYYPNYRIDAFRTINKIDMTNAKKIYVTWECPFHRDNAGNDIMIFASSDPSQRSIGIEFRKEFSFDKTTNSYDVSTITGDHYIYVSTRTEGNSTNFIYSKSELKVYKVWVEY